LSAYFEISNLKHPHDALKPHFITLASYSDINKFPGAEIIGILYSKNYIHIVTQIGRKIQKLADLRGKKICCGEINSITAVDAMNVFISENKITGVNITCKNCSLTDQQKKLISKDIDAFIVTSDVPRAIVTEVAKTESLVLIPIPEANFLKIQKISSILYDRAKIHLYDYTNRSEDKGNYIETLSRINLVVALAGSDDETVYQVTRALYDTLPEHYKQLLVSNWPQITSYKISRLSALLHPAAKKFYYDQIERIKLEREPKPWYKDQKIIIVIALAIAVAAALIAFQNDPDPSNELVGEDEVDPPPAGDRGGFGACFIVTAANGTPIANQLPILREFRDKYLFNNFIGRKFVKTYYKYSPAMAALIFHNHKFRFVSRVLLLPLIGFSHFMIHVGTFIKVIVSISISFSLILTLIYYGRRKHFSKN